MARQRDENSRDALLVLEAQAGNVRAFEVLYKTYNQQLLRFAYRFSGDENLARDSVQEAWLTLSKTLKKLKDPTGFRVWAYKTVRWRVTDQVRRRGAVLEPLDDHSNVGQIDAVTEQHVTADQLETHLSRLSAEDRSTLSLFYLGDLSLIEIATVLEIPVGTVKSRLNRARNQLKQQMTGDSHE